MLSSCAAPVDAVAPLSVVFFFVLIFLLSLHHSPLSPPLCEVAAAGTHLLALASGFLLALEVPPISQQKPNTTSPPQLLVVVGTAQNSPKAMA